MQKLNGVLSLSIFAVCLTGVTPSAAEQAPVALGSNSTFAILAGTEVSVTGGGVINGNIGVSPGTAFVAGVPAVTVNGTVYAGGPIAAQAQADLTKAFSDAAGRSIGPVSVSGNLGGLTLAPGLYKSTSSLAISSGDLTLDAQGNPSAVFIFQMASTLTTTSGRKVILAGGANAANIFWQVGSSATLGTTSVFQGNILAAVSITVNTGATLTGRALAQSGAVTLDAGGGDSVTPPVPPPFNIQDPGTFVNQLYLDLLDRPADQVGFSNWTTDLNSGAQSRSEVAEQFFLSPEIVNSDLLVVKFYIATLGRDPDYSGWYSWDSELHSGAQTVDQVLSAFLASAESQNIYGSLDNGQFVTTVYQNVLLRAPDSDGYNHWVNQLNTGAMTREQVMYQFIVTAEFTSRVASQANVNLAYLGFLRRSADPSGLTYWEQQLSTNLALSDVINAFITNSEYLARF